MSMNYQKLSNFYLANLIRNPDSTVACNASHELGRRQERDDVATYLRKRLGDYLSHLESQRPLLSDDTEPRVVLYAEMNGFWECVWRDLKDRKHIS